MSIDNQYLYDKLIKSGYIREPRYNIWLSRGYWKPFDAALLFNGIDPHIRFATEISIIQKNMEKEAFPASKDDVENIASFLTTVFEEKEAIETWQIFPDPLILINTYLQKIGNIPKCMLKLAKKSFLELYQKRNYDEKTKEYWISNWQNNIAAPFLKLIIATNKKLEQKFLDKDHANQHTAIGEKTILEESAESRAVRIRNRGYEIYKLFKEQYPNKKINKKLIAEQIIREEEPLYKIISSTNPNKKQPALATYIKEIRKVY